MKETQGRLLILALMSVTLLVGCQDPEVEALSEQVEKISAATQGTNLHWHFNNGPGRTGAAKQNDFDFTQAGDAEAIALNALKNAKTGDGANELEEANAKYVMMISLDGLQTGGTTPTLTGSQTGTVSPTQTSDLRSRAGVTGQFGLGQNVSQQGSTPLGEGDSSQQQTTEQDAKLLKLEGKVNELAEIVAELADSMKSSSNPPNQAAEDRS